MSVANPNELTPLNGSPLPMDPGGGGGGGGGSFGSMFGNTNAAAGSGTGFAPLPKPFDPPGPAQHVPDFGPASSGPPMLVSIDGNPTGGLLPMTTPVTAPTTPGSPAVPSATDIGHNFVGINPLDPGFTQQLFNYLQSMIGQGATPFNSTTDLPTGGTTAPGQLSAPLNQLMQQLQQFYSGGSTNAPGLNSLTQFATDGRPIDQTPAWQAMVDSMRRNTDQQEAQMREQFSRTGNLVGSPYGTAEADFRSQTAKDQNAQLLAAQTQAQEAAAGRRLGASEGLLAGNQAFSSNLQGMDQNAINAQLQEFLRRQPEYSPLLNLQYGAGTTFPPVANYNSGIGILGSLLQNLGGLAGLIPRGGGSTGGSSGSGGSGGGITLPGGIHIPIPGWPGSGGGVQTGDPGMGGGVHTGGGITPNSPPANDPNHPGWIRDPNTGLMIPPGGTQLNQDLENFNSGIFDPFGTGGNDPFAPGGMFDFSGWDGGAWGGDTVLPQSGGEFGGFTGEGGDGDGWSWDDGIGG